MFLSAKASFNVDLANGLLRNVIEVVTGGELGASRMMTMFEWHNKVKVQ